MKRQQISLGLTALIACLFYAGTSTAGDNETAITTWVVIFNHPGECISVIDQGCGEEDFGVEAVQADFCFLAGQSVQANRRVTLAGRVAEGSPDVCELGIGIVNTDEAEIHMILQEHGPSLPAGAGREEQVSSFWGNCNPGAADFDTGDPGSCVDTQFAVHNPADAVDGVSVSPVQRFDESEVDGSRSTLYRQADGIRMVNHTRLD